MMTLRRFLTGWVACFGVAVFAPAGIPEPDVIFYGVVFAGTGTSAYVPGDVSWTVAGNNQAAASRATTLVTVNGQTFYISRVAFETRRLADNSLLAASPNTLEQTTTPAIFSRSARVDGKAATISNGATTFTYGAATQGLADRVDLRVGGESFTDWSQRLFGSQVVLSGDADGDGMSNYAEYLAGTDPKNRQSGLFMKSFVPVNGGGFTFSWDSVSGRIYSVERSSDLQNWTAVQANVTGTGGVMTYTDANTAGAPRLFYRVTLAGVATAP